MKNVISIKHQIQYNTGLFSPKEFYKKSRNNDLVFKLLERLIQEVRSENENSIHLNFFYHGHNELIIPVIYPEFETVEYIVKENLLVRKGDPMTVVDISKSGYPIPLMHEKRGGTLILYKSNPLKFPEKHEHLRYFKIENELYGNTLLPGQKLFLDKI